MYDYGYVSDGVSTVGYMQYALSIQGCHTTGYSAASLYLKIHAAQTTSVNSSTSVKRQSHFLIITLPLIWLSLSRRLIAQACISHLLFHALSARKYTAQTHINLLSHISTHSHNDGPNL